MTAALSVLHSTMKIDLPHGITLYTGEICSITSGLKVLEMDEEDVAWNCAVDAVESLILALAGAGVEIDDKFKAGVQTALDAISN